MVWLDSAWLVLVWLGLPGHVLALLGLVRVGLAWLGLYWHALSFIGLASRGATFRFCARFCSRGNVPRGGVERPKLVGFCLRLRYVPMLFFVVFILELFYADMGWGGILIAGTLIVFDVAGLYYVHLLAWTAAVSPHIIRVFCSYRMMDTAIVLNNICVLIIIKCIR